MEKTVFTWISSWVQVFVMEVEHREDKNLFETFDWWVRSGVTGCETEKEFEDLMKSRGNSPDMTR